MYIDSKWYVNTLDTNCTIGLIGIIRLCSIVIQCIIARFMPNSYKNSLYIAKYMYLLVKLVILGCFIVIKAIICSGNRGLAKSLVHFETLNSDYKTYKRLIITNR